MSSQNTQQNNAYNKHAIQLAALEVVELTIKRNPGVELPEQLPETAAFSLGHGHSAYDKEEHKIGVRLSAEIGIDQKDFPFALRAEILGVFDVDESRFPIVHIEHWATHNGPLVLYPYLREQVYGLTTRAGQPDIHLPLFEVPTFKITAQQT